MGQIFSEFGIPDMFTSDNGPHFSSAEFRSFAGKWNFDHIMSSPTYPKSKGFIEHQVETVKSILRESKSVGNDFHLALPAWISTPVSYNLVSPAQLLMGRKVKSLVPTRIANTHDDDYLIHEELEKHRHSQKLYHEEACSGTRNVLPLP